jgi:hypothetical protein
MRAIGFLRESGDIERLEGVSTGAALGGVLESLGVNYGFQVEKRALKQLVDYNEVEFTDVGHLDGSVLEADFDDIRRVFAPALQPRAQFFLAGRQDEDEDGVGEGILDL